MDISNYFIRAALQPNDFKTLKHVLKQYDPSKVENFIEALNLLCTTKQRHININKSYNITSKDAANNRSKLLKKCCALHDELANLLNNFGSYIEPEAPYLQFVKDTSGVAKSLYQYELSTANYHNHIKSESKKLYEHTYDYLSTIKCLIGNESHNLTKGRKKVNKDKFYTQIAELFDIYISKPTTSKDGDFANVVRIVNEALGIANEDQDPSRALKQAVEYLPKKR